MQEIIAQRKKKGVTQKALASVLGVTQGAVSQWESGLSRPDIKYLIQMAAYFECSVDQLLQGVVA